MKEGNLLFVCSGLHLLAISASLCRRQGSFSQKNKIRRHSSRSWLDMNVEGVISDFQLKHCEVMNQTVRRQSVLSTPRVCWQGRQSQTPCARLRLTDQQFTQEYIKNDRGAKHESALIARGWNGSSQVQITLK